MTVVRGCSTDEGANLPGFPPVAGWLDPRKDEATGALTTQALAAGLRAIDTANQRTHSFEAAVGAAVAASQARGEGTRARLFLQTKLSYARAQEHRLAYERSAARPDQVKGGSSPARWSTRLITANGAPPLRRPAR